MSIRFRFRIISARGSVLLHISLWLYTIVNTLAHVIRSFSIDSAFCEPRRGTLLQRAAVRACAAGRFPV